MAPILESYFPKVNQNEHAFKMLADDVAEIYSTKDHTSKKYEKKYAFENNKVHILFHRVWIGKGLLEGIDIQGSAVIELQKKDASIEEKIKKIVQSPTHERYWEQDNVPIVKIITFHALR